MKREPRVRRVFGIIVCLCLLYFVGGWIGTYFEWISQEAYLGYAGIVGGLASVGGLVGLTRPAISGSDFRVIQMDTLASIANTARELQVLEEARAHTAGELFNLEERKREMELLVKRASLALFLTEQYAHHQQQVMEEIEHNARLRSSLARAKEVADKLEVLNAEIETNPNVRQLQEIISAATRRQSELDEALNQLGPFVRSVVIVVRVMQAAIGDLFVNRKFK